MKTQAWGWLAAAALAAGLNSSYHDGGFEWAHRIADQVGHNTGAALALATGHADRFLAEAQMISERQTPSRPLAAALAEVRHSMASSESNFDRYEAMSDEFTARQNAQLARIEASRDRMEAQLTCLRTANLTPVMVRVPTLRIPAVRVPGTFCPRVRVSVPRLNLPPMPRITVPPVPMVRVDYSSPGPI